MTRWLRAATLTQPWCGLVAAGIKLIENRDTPLISASNFGQPFALHASREIDEDVYERIRQIAPELSTHNPDGSETRWYRLSRITSAVIGIATCHRAIRCDPGQASFALAGLPARDLLLRDDQRRWFFGPIGYCLGDVRTIEPVKCRGWQSFWYMTPKLFRERDMMSDAELAVQAQL